MTPQPITIAERDTALPLPLRHRLYARYCDGLSAAAIAREFSLDRQTVTRHLRIIEEQLHREHTRDLERLRLRALHAQYRIQATALAALEREEAIEAESLAALAAAQAAGERPPQLYHAQRARLLSVAAHAARTAAQLQGLFHQPSAALIKAHPWITPYPPEKFHIEPAPEPAPDLPDDAYDPTDPDDLPDPPDDDLPTSTNQTDNIPPVSPPPASVEPLDTAPAPTALPVAGASPVTPIAERSQHPSLALDNCPSFGMAPALQFLSAPQPITSPTATHGALDAASPAGLQPAFRSPAPPVPAAVTPEKPVAFCGMPASFRDTHRFTDRL